MFSIFHIPMFYRCENVLYLRKGVITIIKQKNSNHLEFILSISNTKYLLICCHFCHYFLKRNKLTNNRLVRYLKVTATILLFYFQYLESFTVLIFFFIFQHREVTIRPTLCDVMIFNSFTHCTTWFMSVCTIREFTVL